MTAGNQPMPCPIRERIGIIWPKSAIDGIVTMMDAT